MEAVCRAEVVTLHQFFEDWFRGKIADTDDHFARVEKALAEDFVLISPRAAVDDRESILTSIRKAHGSDADFRLWIEDFECRVVAEPLCVVTYKELQVSGGTRSERLSTAMFQQHETAEHGVAWRHLHETWLVAPIAVD